MVLGSPTCLLSAMTRSWFQIPKMLERSFEWLKEHVWKAIRATLTEPHQNTRFHIYRR